MKSTRTAAIWILGFCAIGLLPACARSQMLLEVSGTIMYERPRIAGVAYRLLDERLEGGSAVVKVSMEADPGLTASFDVYPGVAERLPMKEIEDGNYVGEYAFPESVVGGPYTVIVRLRHHAAGEAVWRDPNLINIPLLDQAP